MSEDGKRLYIVHPVSDKMTILELPQEKPTFLKGQDIKIKNCEQEQNILNWAKDIQAGTNEGFQFNCNTNNESFFTKLPQISNNGTLTFAPSATAEGKANVNVQLLRNSTMPDICYTSELQSFEIVITLCDPIFSLKKIGNGEIVINNELRVLPPYEKQFAKGQKINLFARPYSSNWLFSHWKLNTNDIVTTNPIDIDINKDTTLYAVFIENTVVKLHIDGNCSILMDGQEYELPYSNLLTPGISFSIQVPDNFSHWSGGFEGNNNPLSLKINKGIHLIAHCNTENSSQYYLKKGFNLIALSVVPENSSLEKIFPQVRVAYSYEKGRYARANYLETGKAYWIQMPTTRTLTVSGFQFSNYRAKLTKGWQMVGGIYKTAEIKTIPENCVQTIYEFSDGAYKKSQIIEPAKGYWIYLNQDCEILIND